MDRNPGRLVEDEHQRVAVKHAGKNLVVCHSGSLAYPEGV
jgi:hypothetical protein